MGHSGRTRLKKGTRHKAGPDRRLACRYRAATRHVILTTAKSGAPVDDLAELDNVSTLGCLVRSRCTAKLIPGESVWLKVPGEISTPVIEGAVISAVRPFLGKWVIRIRFAEPLSYILFKRLVYGEEGIDMNQRQRPEYENDQFWK